MQLKTNHHCDNGVELHRKDCEWVIKLPPRKTFIIEIDLELTNIGTCPIQVRMALKNKSQTLNAKDYYTRDRTPMFHIKDKQTWKTSACDQDNYLELRLILPQFLKVYSGTIHITEV